MLHSGKRRLEQLSLVSWGALSETPAMHKDLAHKRPWLLASLFCAIAFPFGWGMDLPDMASIAWKMACAGLLVPYALRRHHEGDFALIAAVLGFWALGDGLLEFDMRLGAVAFVIGHVIAIWLFARHIRVNPTFSQKALAIAVFIVSPVIAYFLPADRIMAMQVAAYTLFVGAMAGMAWNSNFPRYRVGIGAILFVVSDLLIFAREGALAQAGWIGLAIWVLYYGGVLMIATGVVTTLVKRGHFVDG